MTLGLPALLDAVESHARSIGGIAGLTSYEPEVAPPGPGIWVAVWLQGIGPARAVSGLNITSARLELAVRLYSRMTTEGQQRTDREIAALVDALYVAYSGDFTLGGNAMQVDLLGANGPEMGGQAGYQSIDGELFRVFTITLPLIIRDTWEQTP